MTAYASLNGGRVISANVTIPYYGAWAADVVMAADTALAAEDTLTIGDLTLTGFVQRAADFAGSRSARMGGGYGGWQKTISSKSYYLSSGIPLSMVLGDAASESGETWNSGDLASYASSSIGSAYMREHGPAQRVLRQLAGPIWWIDGSGATRLAPRSAASIASQFEVIHWEGGRGAFEIATETLGDWMPGRTFTSPTVMSARTIALTTIDVDNSGKLRLAVRATP